jgi:hypothetical protein
VAVTFQRAVDGLKRLFGRGRAFQQLLSARAERFPVDGALAQRYRTLLREILGHECTLESFSVDRGGWSPEVAGELGPDYLKTGDTTRLLILLSPDQSRAAVNRSGNSYQRLVLDRLYEQGRTLINFLTFKHLLWGELDDHAGLVERPDDLLLVETVELSLDTQSRDLKKLALFHRQAAEMLRGNGLNRDSSIHAMLHLRNELVQRLGDLRNLEFDGPVTLRMGVGSFFSDLFGGCYVLRDTESCLIHGDQGKGARELISSCVPCFRYDDPKLVDYLQQQGFIELSSDLMEQRVKEMENELLLQQDLNPLRLHFVQRRHYLKQLRSLFPSSYYELRDLLKIRSERRHRRRLGELMAKCTPATRLKLALPLKQPAFVSRLLAEIDPTDSYRLYRYNTPRFEDVFGRATDVHKTCIYETLLQAITSTGQFNPEANAYLSRFTELNRRLRVRFSEEDQGVSSSM